MAESTKKWDVSTVSRFHIAKILTLIDDAMKDLM